MTYHTQNSDKGSYFQSAMIGQEFVVTGDHSVLEWIDTIVKNNRRNEQ